MYAMADCLTADLNEVISFLRDFEATPVLEAGGDGAATRTAIVTISEYPDDTVGLSLAFEPPLKKHEETPFSARLGAHILGVATEKLQGDD